ncbi:MAG: ribokinase [Cyanobacteria bacterium SZAS LIN-5]|nr:ribokinase [Cyanobacteria bacterium SZAS LIN-5]RTL41770.1 MAG: ribokinase [Candidatus Melainabacteria bacterium]
MGKVVVVGSLSQDLVAKAPRFPQKGETLRGLEFGMFAGGKGNNQSMAAARAGAEVSLVGRVGNDSFGQMLIDTLRRNHVDAQRVIQDPEVGTGIAHITVTAEGENAIVIVQQANLRLSPADVEAARATISAAKVLLLQLEVPLETDIAAAKVARAAGTIVAFNPAPAPDDGVLPSELLHNVDIITPNQTEAQQLTGIVVSDITSATEAARKLKACGPKIVIITMGEQGAFVYDETICELIPSFPVHAIDTTAAGDAFCGSLAAALARGEDLRTAVRWACAGGALATTKMGAEPSLPDGEEIKKLVLSAAIH